MAYCIHSGSLEISPFVRYVYLIGPLTLAWWYSFRCSKLINMIEVKIENETMSGRNWVTTDNNLKIERETECIPFIGTRRLDRIDGIKNGVTFFILFLWSEEEVVTKKTIRQFGMFPRYLSKRKISLFFIGKTGFSMIVSEVLNQNLLHSHWKDNEITKLLLARTSKSNKRYPGSYSRDIPMKGDFSPKFCT